MNFSNILFEVKNLLFACVSQTTSKVLDSASTAGPDTSEEMHVVSARKK
jgi:hypothetical protein